MERRFLWSHDRGDKERLSMAGYIAEDIVERIKNDTDILDLINEYVTLKRAGKDYVGLCPFHKEKTPSFTVVPAKNFYHCFGCGASGNAIGFIMRHENLEYPDAIKFLARRAGIEIVEKETGDSPASRIYKAIEYAHNLYIRNLKNSVAYEYLKSRDVNDSIIDELQLGFAPPGWDNLYSAFIKDKLSPAEFEKAGLLVKKDKQQGYYDKFRNRLMFPIKNISGRVIGFGGRALSDEEGPKYLNSPETQIYHKGSVLYGLNWSKNYIRDIGKAIITEGYFDFISLYQADIKNIVAVSGTGFTANQASLLARFCGEIVLLYDADSAGLKATFRAIDVLYNSGLDPYIVRLPEGFDPDSFIREKGPDELSRLIESAMPYLEFIKQSLPDKFANLPISRQEKVINSMIETASGIDDELKHELFTRKAIEVFKLPATVAAKFNAPKKHSHGPKATTGVIGRKGFEMTFLSFLFSNPSYIKESLTIIKSDNFIESTHSEIYKKLASMNCAGFSVGDFLELFPDDIIRRKITEIILLETGGAAPDVRFSELLLSFKKFQVLDRLALIRAEMVDAEKEGEEQELEKLTREYRDLQNVANRKVV
jgi:DNA primase